MGTGAGVGGCDRRLDELFGLGCWRCWGGVTEEDRIFTLPQLAQIGTPKGGGGTLKLGPERELCVAVGWMY